MSSASIKKINSEFTKIIELFKDKENESNWDARDKALLKLRGFISDGKGKEEFYENLKIFNESLCKTLLSLRSALVSNSCQLVQELSTQCQQEIDFLVPGLVQSLIKLVSQSKKISVQLGTQTCVALLSNTSFFQKVFDKFVEVLRDDKSSTVHEKMTEFIVLELEKFGTSGKVDLNTWELAMELALKDANPVARENGKKMFKLFQELYPERINDFIQKVDSTSRKILDRALSRPASSNPSSNLNRSKSSFRSTASKIKASQQQTEIEIFAPPTSHSNNEISDQHNSSLIDLNNPDESFLNGDHASINFLDSNRSGSLDGYNGRKSAHSTPKKKISSSNTIINPDEIFEISPQITSTPLRKMQPKNYNPESTDIVNSFAEIEQGIYNISQGIDNVAFATIIDDKTNMRTPTLKKKSLRKAIVLHNTSPACSNIESPEVEPMKKNGMTKMHLFIEKFENFAGLSDRHFKKLYRYARNYAQTPAVELRKEFNVNNMAYHVQVAKAYEVYFDKLFNALFDLVENKKCVTALCKENVLIVTKHSIEFHPNLYSKCFDRLLNTMIKTISAVEPGFGNEPSVEDLGISKIAGDCLSVCARTFDASVMLRYYVKRILCSSLESSDSSVLFRQVGKLIEVKYKGTEQDLNNIENEVLIPLFKEEIIHKFIQSNNVIQRKSVYDFFISVWKVMGERFVYSYLEPVDSKDSVQRIYRGLSVPNFKLFQMLLMKEKQK